MTGDAARLAAVEAAVLQLLSVRAHPPLRIDVSAGPAQVRMSWSDPGGEHAAAANAAGPGPGDTVADRIHLHPAVVRSPAVGTCRLSRAGGNALVAPGDPVDAATVVATVVVLGVTLPVVAGLAGTVGRALVEDGAAVQYGMPLMELEHG